MRRVDNLGRIVIPKELRKKYGLKEGAELTFEDNGEGILVKVSDKVCKLCGKELGETLELPICRKCINKAKLL